MLRMSLLSLNLSILNQVWFWLIESSSLPSLSLKSLSPSLLLFYIFYYDTFELVLFLACKLRVILKMS